MERMKVQEHLENVKKDIVGHRFRHFKGAIYVVVDIAVHSETAEPMVIYRPYPFKDDDIRCTWVRPLDMFLSEVDHEKYLNVTQKLRFERID